MKILMVCLGNICRSPLAEGIMKTKAKENDLDWTVASAGTGSWHVGNLPDRRSIAVAKKHGIDITDQRAMQFEATHFDEYDLIFAMDASNYQDILRLATDDTQKKKVQLILDELFPGENVDVPDPYSGIQSNFDQVFEMLEEACESIATKLLEKK